MPRDANLLTRIGETLYGQQWQTNLARDLQLSDPRRIRAWLKGERSIPPGIWADCEQLLLDYAGKANNLAIELQAIEKAEKNT